MCNVGLLANVERISEGHAVPVGDSHGPFSCKCLQDLRYMTIAQHAVSLKWIICMP
jgi:hypothetical protein